MKSLQEIALDLQGYDPQSLSAEQAEAFLQHLAPSAVPSKAVELPVAQALERIVATDIVSPVSVPPHDNSAMDGYAFHSADLSVGGDLRLRCVGTALAGPAWSGQVAQGECLKIMTGAVMPVGLDTVIPAEFTRTDGNQIVFSSQVVKAGDNRRLCGEDLMQGQVALPRGTRLGPAALGLLASLGIPTVPVYARLRVAYFSTGTEILSLGDAPREGAVFDSNRYTVMGMLARLGCEMVDLGVCPDDPELLRVRFQQVASSADVVITSGGISVGEADFTKAMMRELGDVAFWRIAMRPGRPMAVGRIGSCVLFGLPGNPVAVMVTFIAFVRPALLRLMGANDQPLPMVRARCMEKMRKKPGRTEYQRGRLSRAANGDWQVATTGQQGSGVLRSMVEADGLVVLAHDSADVQVGDWVEVMLFDAMG
ncbi:MAG: molybdopterin molybdotransferase MoeA [Alphaproteobacteria bacterium]|nr:molybdopterin molybdotransferase MoeA [Alphaproteobacteria bacterium]